MFPTLRVRSALATLTILSASAVLLGPIASCGGGNSAQSPGTGSGDGGDGAPPGDGATTDGPLGSEGSGGDAGDPCAADTGGTSGTSAITAVWANEGGDKVTQDELRATANASAVASSVWDGHCIQVFGAKNEIVSFNVVLEAATSPSSKVTVSLGNLTGPGGSVIRAAPRSPGNHFDWTTTEVELF